MDLRHDRRASADRTVDALDRTRSNVADREDPGDAGLEALAPVTASAAACERGRVAGQREARAIARDGTVADEVNLGVGAHEEKEVADRPRLFAMVVDACMTNAREAGFVAVQPPDFAVDQQLDLRVRDDPVGQLLRHREREVGPAHEHQHALDMRRQEDRGLTGRIAAADQRDGLTVAQARLDR